MQEFAFCRGWGGEGSFCTRLSPLASGTLGKEFVSGLEPGDFCHHAPFLHCGLGIGYLLHFAWLLRSDFSWLLESVSLACSNLYRFLLSSVSFPNALLLSSPSSSGARGEHGGGQASSASIFLTFPSWLSGCLSPHPNLLSRGLATRPVLAGSCPGWLGLQLGHSPIAPLEICFQKVGKLRVGKDAGRLWEELVAGVT